jgi:uncharacterized iron-regulated membrane protein
MRGLRFVHRWLGIILALPLLVQGLTGTVLTLEPVIPTWSRAAAGPLAPFNAVLAAAMAEMPSGMRPTRYMPPEEPGGAARVQFAPRGAPRGPGMVVLVDPVTAKALGPAAPATGIMEWVKRLHTTLLVPEWGGRQLAGWLGVGLLTLTVLGVPLWWPSREARAAGRWKDGFTVPRQARGARLQRRLHGAMGIWLLLLLLATSITGIMQGFPQTSRALLGVLAAEQSRGGRAASGSGVEGRATLPDLDAATRLAEVAAPGTRLRLVVLSQNGTEPLRLILGPPDTEGARTATTVLVDAAATRVLSVQTPAGASMAETTLRWAHDLHFGQGFGPVWRGFTVLVGVALPGFAVTGVTLWLLKSRNRRRVRAASVVVSAQQGDRV